MKFFFERRNISGIPPLCCGLQGLTVQVMSKSFAPYTTEGAMEKSVAHFVIPAALLSQDPAFFIFTSNSKPLDHGLKLAVVTYEFHSPLDSMKLPNGFERCTGYHACGLPGLCENSGFTKMS